MAINSKPNGYIIACISAISYGLIPLFVMPVKNTGASLDKTLFYRFFISAVFILGYLLYKNIPLKLTRFELFVVMVLGLFYALSSEFLFLAYDYMGAGVASTILFVYPVIVALIMFFFYKEHITKLTIASLALTLLGVFILSTKDSIFIINGIGLIIALLSALCYGLYIVTVNKAKIALSGLQVTFYSLVFTSAYYLVKMGVNGDTLAASTSFYINATLFALITTVISMIALIYAIKLIGSTSTAIMGALEPVVAVAVSVLIFHEAFTLSLFVGAVLILAGVILNILSGNKKSVTH